MRKWSWIVGVFICLVGLGGGHKLSARVWGLQQETTAVIPIGQVQGRGTASPYLDREVTVRGVVTGFYEDRNAAGTVYYTAFVQDLPGQKDGDSETSDGIALFLGRKRPFFQVGDQVQVRGRVTEFYGLTELDDAGLSVTVEAQGVPLPPPVTLSLPAADGDPVAHFERWEGMRVAWPPPALVVGPTFSGCGLAVMEGVSLAERPLRRRAAAGVQHVFPILHHSDVSCAGFPDVKAGDRISGLVGPLTYHFDQYKLVQQPQHPLAVTAAPLPPLPPPPPVTGSAVTVATFNLENYFDDRDDTGSDAEPKPTAAEIDVKQTKLAYALGHTLGCPTLVGVQEVENEALLLQLAARTADHCGFTYTVTHRESVDRRGIDVALLSDPRRATVAAADLRQGCTPLVTGIVDESAACPSGQSPLFSRPPLQVTVAVDGYRYVIFVNHFKSKRGGEAESASRRLAQAQHQGALVDTLLAADAQARILVLGDLNDYEQSPPVQHLAQRLVNVLASVPAAERYTFVYGGVAQTLDGILVSPALAAAVAQVQIFHVNADYPAAWGTETGPERLPYRATDHDLPLLVLRLPAEETAVVTTPFPPSAAPLPAATATPLPTPTAVSATGHVGTLPGILLVGAGLMLAALLVIGRLGESGSRRGESPG